MPPYPGTVALADDLERIAASAAAQVDGGQTALAGILATEPAAGARIYVCAFESEGGERSWLALDGDGAPVASERSVRDAVSIAALCEVAEESAFPGDLDELRAQLVALRITEGPDGIDEADAAARELQHVLGTPPHLASPTRLDEIGQAARRLELALDPTAPSPFTAAMRSAVDVAEALWVDVRGAYRGSLDYP
jgi:hypothetical protein